MHSVSAAFAMCGGGGKGNPCITPPPHSLPPALDASLEREVDRRRLRGVDDAEKKTMARGPYSPNSFRSSDGPFRCRAHGDVVRSFRHARDAFAASSSAVFYSSFSCSGGGGRGDTAAVAGNVCGW